MKTEETLQKTLNELAGNGNNNDSTMMTVEMVLGDRDENITGGAQRLLPIWEMVCSSSRFWQGFMVFKKIFNKLEINRFTMVAGRDNQGKIYFRLYFGKESCPLCNLLFTLGQMRI